MLDFRTWTSNATNVDSLNRYYQQYIKQFPPELTEGIEKILSLVEYYDEEKMALLCDEYCKNSIWNEKIYPINTVIDNNPHSSNDFINSLKRSHFSKKVKTTFGNPELIENNKYLICDDYSGTGGTMIDVVNEVIKSYKQEVTKASLFLKPFKYIKYRRKLKKLEFVFYPAICHVNVEKNIKEEMKQRYPQIKTKFLTIKTTQNNFFSSPHFNENDEKKLEKINDFCSVGTKYAFGYEKTGELLSMYYGTPNNTIGFLWYGTPKSSILPFFSRTPQINVWFKDGHFTFDYKLDKEVEKKVNSLNNFRIIKKNEKKILIYKLLGFDDNCIKKIVKCNNDYDNIILNLQENCFLNSDFSAGKKIPRKLLDSIIRYKSNLNYSSESDIVMNLNALKNK